MSDNPFVADFAVWAFAFFAHVVVAIVDVAVIGKFRPIDGRVGSEIHVVGEACPRYEAAELCRRTKCKVHIAVIGVATCAYREDFNVLFLSCIRRDFDCIVKGASASAASCNAWLGGYSPVGYWLVYGHVEFDFPAGVGGFADMYRDIDTGTQAEGLNVMRCFRE